MSVDCFKEWPDDERLVLGKKIVPFLTHYGSVLFLVGNDQTAPYRNEIRAGWIGKKNDLLGILKPVKDGVDLELRVGKVVADTLFQEHDSLIEATKDGSTNKADKIIVHLTGTELPDEFETWIRKAYSFVVGKRPLT